MARYSFVVLKVPLNTSKTNTIICQQSFLLLYSARRTTIHNAERSERDLLVTAKLLNILGTRDQGLKMFGIAVVLPFPPSFPFPSVPSPLLYHPVPSFTLPFPQKYGPQIHLGVWGSAVSSPSRNRFLVHFSPKIRHLVAKILMIFLRINLPNFMYFDVCQTWTGCDGNCFLSGPIILQVMQNNQSCTVQDQLFCITCKIIGPLRTDLCTCVSVSILQFALVLLLTALVYLDTKNPFCQALPGVDCEKFNIPYNHSAKPAEVSSTSDSVLCLLTNRHWSKSN